MPAGDYLGQEEFRITARPGRCAYLIAEGDTAGFVRAVQEATSRWGGMTEPIVPVGADGELARGWMQFVQVAHAEELVNVSANASHCKGIADAIGLPVVRLDDIDRSGPGQFTCYPSSVDQPRSEPDLSYVFKYSPAQAMPRRWVGAASDLDLWAITAAGSLITANSDAELAEGAPIAISRDPLEVARAQIRGDTLIVRTGEQFSENWASASPFPMSAVVWVCDLDHELLECLYYWNRRALRSLRFEPLPMMIVPEGDLDNWLQFGVQASLVFAGRPDEFEPDAIFCSHSVSHARLTEIASSWGMVDATKEPRSGKVSPPPSLRPKPFTFRVDLDPTPWLLFERRYGAVKREAVQIFREQTTVKFEPPVTFHRGGRLLLTLGSDSISSLPKRPPVATLIHQHASWQDDDIQLASIILPEYSFTLRIPDRREVAATLLDQTTRAWRLSDKGQLGESVRSMPGDPVVSDPGVYLAAKALVTKRTQHRFDDLRRRALEEADLDLAAFLEEHGGGRLERMNERPQNLQSVPVDLRVPVLEKMVAWHWVERGVRLRCPRCGLTSFVPFGEVTDDALCPGCRSPQQYASESSGITVYYRLNSLIDRAVDQGVLPHLLTIEALQKRSTQGVFLFPGVDIEFPDAEQAEVDIYGVLDAEVLMGEVKTSALEFTEQQVHRDIEIAERLQVDTYLMACLEELPEPTVEKARNAVAASSIDLLMLGPADLGLA